MKESNALLLFDGVCNLCNGFVQFVLLRDPKGYFHFAPLQSDLGKETLRQANLPEEALSTVVLVEHGKVYTHSTVALRTVRHLSGLWPLLYVFVIVPRPIRDWVYNWVAQNRYRWFGKREACMMPRPEWKERFVA